MKKIIIIGEGIAGTPIHDPRVTVGALEGVEIIHPLHASVIYSLAYPIPQSPVHCQSGK